ncbi:cupin-like domain-containing protein [Anabaena sphaerica FACHB-251]|uniref:Cupin-like domain-containing protein n=1 Tax=Anabaena sphaerica FACHB-251 TaxID=2692883 RepID=A0A927A076_9NOST|nr:cupin-like domain-containing protein [Anabaena sphaerica]MBD2293374.1 cupin-like domain-containing protein [Anabaena sphaerica FACHB-251]
MKITPIERINQPSITEFCNKFVIPDKPVILTGVANEWKACEQWTPETFKSMFGDVIAPLRASDDEIEVFFGGLAEKKLISIADYIDSILSETQDGHKRLYLGNIPFDSPIAKAHLDKIRPDFEFPNYFPDNTGNDLRLWIGGANQKSTIHNDNYHNLNAQIFGEKTFLLFAPEEYQKLYATKMDDELWSSPIDPQKPNLSKYPLFDDVTGLEAVLAPGDILFIPAFWWHQARSITPSINVNMWVYTHKICEIWEQHPVLSGNMANVVS